MQVPAGTIEPNESTDAAALREAREETGLKEFGPPQYVGVAAVDMSVYGRRELHERHFFRLPLAQTAPAQWRHVETSGGTAAPEVFEFSWVPLSAVPQLAGGQGAFLHALQRALPSGGQRAQGGKIMTAEKTTMAFGWRVYGLGVMALGMVCLAWGDFDPGQPVPKDFPDRTALAYAAACVHARRGRGRRVASDCGLGRRGAHRLLRAHCRHPDERPRGARPLRRVRHLQRRRRAARDRGGRR